MFYKNKQLRGIEFLFISSNEDIKSGAYGLFSQFGYSDQLNFIEDKDHIKQGYWLQNDEKK